MEKVAFCSDHAGYEMKLQMMEYMKSKGYDVHDFGTYSAESCDYPDYAHPAAFAVERGECAFGIALCGSGNGISMTLNKHQGVRAGLAWNKEIAELIRQHNDANVLVMPGRFITNKEAEAILDKFFSATFEGGRHARRVAKIPVSGKAPAAE